MLVMQAVKFTVLGRPQPQGSIKAFMIKGRPRLTSTNAKVKPWRQDAGWLAAEAGQKADWLMGDEQIQPVAIFATFTFARPKSAKKRTNHTVKPDLDKLGRALLDSMTGILYADDSQVIHLSINKRYGSPEQTDVEVIIIEPDIKQVPGVVLLSRATHSGSLHRFPDSELP